jgi:flagellar biosynthesis GTPase FlhF
MGTLSKDGVVSLWSVATWNHVARLDSDHRVLHYFSFQSEESMFAADKSGSTLRFWRVAPEQIASLDRAKAKQYKTAKIALVGDNGVGKTGLGWRLAHGSFREHSSTTASSSGY